VNAPVEASLRADVAPLLEDFPYRLTDNVRFADLDPQPARQQRGLCDLFRDRSRHADEGPKLRADAGGAGLDHGTARHAFRAELRWPGTIEMGLGLSKFGRTSVTFDQVVFSEGRCVASAQSVSVLIDEASRKPNAIDRGDHREFSTLAAPGDGWPMKRAALFCFIVAVMASRPATADEFHREELRIAMPAAGSSGLEALLIRPSGPQRYPLALISHGASSDAAERQEMSPYGFLPGRASNSRAAVSRRWW